MCAGTALGFDSFPGTSDPSVAFGISQVYLPPLTRLGFMAKQEKYWFNTRTRDVEYGLKSLSLDRLGPFETEEEARRAEQIVADRAKRILEEDLEED
jgi:hypothetical protein